LPQICFHAQGHICALFVLTVNPITQFAYIVTYLSSYTLFSVFFFFTPYTNQNLFTVGMNLPHQILCYRTDPIRTPKKLLRVSVSY
jgi:hypothetical protein